MTHSDVNLGDGVLAFHNRQDLLEYIAQINDEVFVIGGAQIYRQFFDEANKLVLTEVDKSEPKADVYFPSFDKADWNCTEIARHEDNGIKYKHLIYKRR